ncbi:MAG: GNAT family N-acetyltransferase [Trueperaceae bacterium]|nr:MAG: GNAT family N-acetyltransferase [Trueperaceae bacterium]
MQKVASRRDQKRFIEYPYRKYRGLDVWVPPLVMGEREKFDPKRNPFFEHARISQYLAIRAGEVVGRIAAIDDDNHNRTHNDNLLFFGFFEAEDEACAHQLLATVEKEAVSLGRQAVRGPTNPSMNDGAGFQIDGFDTPPYVMMPQNPPEYPAFVESAGYQKVKDLFAWHFDVAKGPTDRLLRLAKRVKERYKPLIRPADMRNFRREIDILKTFYNSVWEKNWGFVKYTDKEFEHMAKDLKLIVDPELVLFVEVDGDLAGLCLTIPDINQVLIRFNGRLFPFGIFHLLNRKKTIDRARLAVLGVLPEFRNKGLELVLMDEVSRRAKERGIRAGECSWILEDNTSMNRAIEASEVATLYKTYRLYQKPLALT